VKALVKKDYSGEVGINDIPEPLTLPGTVKIEVKAAGICGTDLHILKNEYKHNVPVVMGHEFSGVVVDAGQDVKNCSVGDRVVSLTAAITCGTCEFCITGVPMLCRHRLSIGSGVNGAFAKYLVIDHRLINKIPENVTFDQAALTEPLACVVHGVMEMTRIRAGDIVVISGPGAIGLLAMQVVRAEGGTAVVCGTVADKGRLEIARQLGADYVVDISSEDAKELVLRLTNGYGADAAIECAGAEGSARNCLELLRGRGKYHQLGLFGKPIVYDLDMIAYKEINLTSSFASTHMSFKTALKLLALKKVNVEAVISAKLPLEQWEKGFNMLEMKGGLKVLLYP